MGASLAAAFADGHWGRYHGPYTEQLIDRLAGTHQVEHVHLCSSGTIAVELALRGLKVGEGDEVVLAGYDFPGNFRSIEAVAARPVLVDLDPSGWFASSQAIEEALTPQVRAVIVSHLHGSLAPMRQLRELADRRGFALVEDACQSPGALVDGRPAGSWGDVGILSFGGSKLLTAGRGGAVLTNRDDVAQRIRVFTDRGNDAFPMSQLQTAALLPQLDSLADRNAVRLQNAQRLLAQLKHLPLLESLQPDSFSATSTGEPAGNRPAFYKLGWLLSAAGTDSTTRRWLIAALQAEGIAIDEGFRGFVRRSSARCRTVGSLDRAAHAAAGTLILHHPALLQPTDYIDRLARTINEVVAALPQSPR